MNLQTYLFTTLKLPRNLKHYKHRLRVFICLELWISSKKKNKKNLIPTKLLLSNFFTELYLFKKIIFFNFSYPKALLMKF